MFSRSHVVSDRLRIRPLIFQNYKLFIKSRGLRVLKVTKLNGSDHLILGDYLEVVQLFSMKGYPRYRVRDGIIPGMCPKMTAVGKVQAQREDIPSTEEDTEGRRNCNRNRNSSKDLILIPVLCSRIQGKLLQWQYLVKAGRKPQVQQILRGTHARKQHPPHTKDQAWLNPGCLTSSFQRK